MRTFRVTFPQVAAAACLSVAALSACASGDSAETTASASAAPSTTSAVPESATPQSPAPDSPAPESAAPESAAPESAAPESAAPESAAGQQGPQYVADAILGELSSQGASSLTDQLVTIAMSPVTRQLAEELGLKAELKTKGDAVLLVISRGDEQCTVTVSDPPRMARGVSCR